MQKLAEVLELNDEGTIKVKLYKHEKCSGCGLCNRHMHPGSILDVDNSLHSSPGDMIRLKVDKKFSVMEYFMFYLLPPLAFFIIVFGGVVLAPQSLVPMAAAFGSLIITLPASVIYRKRYRPNYKASVIGRA